MVNTMEDLRREVATRLRNTLHGREIDMIEHKKPRLPHMLGITPIGKIHDPQNEEMTLLDARHQFWSEYEKPISDKAARQELETAVRSLREDDIFRMTYPYGEEAEVVYCEVDELTTDDNIQTSCQECGANLDAQPDLVHNSSSYYISVSLDCDECGFSGTFKRKLLRQ